MKADNGKTNVPAPGQDPYWMESRDRAARTHFGRRPSSREYAREDLMRVWYGEDEARLEITARRRPARPVGAAVDKIMGSFNLGPSLLLADLIKAWPTLVGVDAAKHSRPAIVKEARLQIEVFDAPWRYVLETMHKKSIQAKVREFTADRITEIQFIAAGRRQAAANSSPPKPETPPSPPRSNE